MSRVVVLSRNPGLAWGLAAHDRDLVDIRPHQVDTWLDERITDSVDLVVIDLDDPARSVSIVASMRASGQMAPALVVTSDDDRWSQQAVGDLPGAQVLPLPITTESLQAAVHRALEPPMYPPTVAVADPAPGKDDRPLDASIRGSAAGSADPGAASGSEQQPPGTDSEPAVVDPTAAVTVAPALTSAPSTDPAKTTARVISDPAERLPGIRRSSRTAKTVREAVAGADLLGQIEQFARPAPRTEPIPAPRGRNEPVAAVPVAPVEPVRQARGMDSANALARSLMLRVDELYSVTETADVIVADALAHVTADAAVLMLPDLGRWRVAAGVGLGTIERRFELDATSWVVTHVARANKGVLVEDTDVARRPFQRAPLASRRHLLAAPIPLVEGVLLVARDEDPPFDEDQLNVLAGIADEAGLLLAAALDVRELARKLQAYSELDH